MNTSRARRPALGFSIYYVRSLVSRIFCKTARESTYIRRHYTRAMACHTVWMFSVPRQRTLSVLYSAYALWLMLRLIQRRGVYTGTRNYNPYWPVRSIGSKHADEHAWLCLTSHIRAIFAVRLWYYCSMSILVFLRYVAFSVSKSLCFHSNGQHFLPPPEARLRYGY